MITRVTWYLLGLGLTKMTANFRQPSPDHRFYRQQREPLDKGSRLWEKIIPLPGASQSSKKGQVGK